MRLAVLTIVMTVVSGTLSFAQEKPLAEAAREARANKPNPSRPTKVVTNEDLNAGGPITPTDDPLKVLDKARAVLLRDHAHSCRMQSSGNSGTSPGWTKNKLTEVAAPDRIRITADETGPELRGEWIIIGNDSYLKRENGPWKKIGPDEARFWSGRLESLQLPDELNLGYQSGDLKFIRQETVNGSPTFLYRDVINTSEIQRTINIWIGVDDNHLRKTEMLTFEKDRGGSVQETTSCSYGLAITITPPI